MPYSVQDLAELTKQQQARDRQRYQFWQNSGEGVPLASLKRGGTIKKTGTYKLHKGEKVLSAAQAKKIRAKADKILRRRG